MACRVATVVLVLTLPLGMHAQTQEVDDPVFDRLMAARSMRCHFDKGSFGEWANGVVSVKEARDLLVLVFDSIDLTAQTARLIGNVGAEDVIALAAIPGVTFIEQTPKGSFNFTTVFATAPTEGSQEFVAVTSRHMALTFSLLPSQRHGTCRLLE